MACIQDARLPLTREINHNWKRSFIPREGQVMKCEEEIISCIQDASLLPLAREAREIGMIPQIVKNHLEALAESNAPHPLMCRYLMVHVYREMDSPDSLNFKMWLDSFKKWLELLSKYGVDGSVIHKMRQNDVIDEVEGEEGYASEGEDWVESKEVDSAGPEGVAASTDDNNRASLVIPKPSKKKPSKNFLLKIKKLFKKSVKSRPEASIENYILYEKHLSALTEVLVECSHKWREIAIFLNLPQYIIENISHKNMSGILSLNKVLLAWLKRESSDSKLPTLESLEEALRSRTVGLGTDANNLRKDFLEQCSRSTDCVQEPKRKMHKGRKISKDKKEFEIVSQTRDIEVKDSKSVLFEVRMHVSGCADVSLEYQWYKYEEKVMSGKGCMLCIPRVDLTAEGSYTCEISACHRERKDESESIRFVLIKSEPMILTVITPLDQYEYKSILINAYTEQPEIPKDWPPVSHSTFINLALIKQERINNNSYSRCTIRGDADDIMKDKESIRYEEVFSHLRSGSRLLIEGRPGSGKTTLVHKVSRDWAKGKLKFNHCKLLLLIHLGAFLNDPEVDLEHIIKCYYHLKADVDNIVTYVHRRSGLGLYLILDGLDEYIPRKSIFDLIERKILPRSVVIVASRPAAVARFRYIETKQVEVLGFLNDQISEYINGYIFSVKSKCEDLHKYLDEHPNVHRMCYLPIHTAMVCYLFDRLDVDLPQTETEIYEQFTRHTILRSISRHSDNLMRLDSIESLPEQEKEVWSKISTLAYEKTVSGKQSVLQSDVDHFFNSAESNDFFGLITVDIKAIGCGFQKMYTFLHLTFQEFIAAYHISRLKRDEQHDLITLHGESKHMLQVCKFYCGLVQFDESCNQFKTLIDSMTQNCDTLFTVQCSFESQQQHTCDSVIESNSLSFKDKFLTPSDFTAIGYVIFNTAQHIVHNLVFDSCTISREGIDTLYEKGGEKLSLITTLCFHGHNCTCEQLRLVNILVHKLPLLETLDITDTDLGEQEVLALTDNMNHSNLQILKVGSISNALYSAFQIPLLLVNSFRSRCISFFNVCFNEIFKDSKIIDEVLKMLPYYFFCVKNLPVIRMISCPMQYIEFRILSADLKVNGICTRLSLIDCNIDNDKAELLSDSLKLCIHLSTLELAINHIGNVGANALAVNITSCTKLRTLNLSCNEIGDEGAMAIANAVKDFQDFKLFLWNNKITQSCVGIPLDLHTLAIYDLNSKDTSAVAITQMLQHSDVSILSNLFAIDISHNKIGNDDANALSDCIKNLSNLCSLIINSNLLGYKGALSLGDALRHCENLHTLNISSNDIGHKGAIALSDGLKHCINLHIFDISSNHIGDEGTITLSDVLKHCINLHTFNIRSNDIGDEGAIALSDGLKHCINLHTFDISSNHIGNRGAFAISNCLKSCIKLHSLNISNNIIGREGAISLGTSLEQCHNLHTFNINFNSIDNETIAILSNLLKHVENCLLIGKHDVL